MICEGNKELRNELICDEVIFSKECYESVTPKRKGVLRTIKGPVAEWDNLNRNKRKYTENLWDRVLASDYVQEQKEHKTLYGEANHPENRFDIDFERVSHNIVEMWKVPDKKQVYAEIDILDTPLGNILNVLYEYGSVIGYSSRAGGVLHKHKDFVEVDEKSYHFVTFDAVPYPSVQSARPLNEGVENTEVVNISEEAHKKIIQIIEESGKKDLKVLRDFIYTLEGYNLDKEIAMLEGLDVDKETSSETLKDTTLCLLKESYKQINTLKSENNVMESKVLNAEKLANDYKSQLDASLEKIKEMSEKAENLENVNEEVSTLNEQVEDLTTKNTILLNTIKEYEDTLEEHELNLLEMAVLNKDIKKSNFIIEGLNNDKAKLQVTIEDLIIKNSNLLEQLTEAQKYSDYEEISEELKSSKVEIKSLTESYNHCNSLLESTTRELDKTQDSLEQAIEDIDTLTESKIKADMVVEKLEIKLNESMGEIDNLKTTIETLNETVTTSNTRISSYKQDLVKAVCENYGINSTDVLKKVDEDFTLGDLHIICDSVDTHKPLEVVSVEEPQIIDESTKSLNEKKARLGAMFTGSRRGILNKNI